MASIDSLMFNQEHDSLMSYLTPPNSPPRCSPVASLFVDLDAPLSNNTFLFTQDDITFDKLSAALSRALTPPPESLAPPTSKPHHAAHAAHTMTPTRVNPNFHPNCQTCIQQESARVLTSPSLHSPSGSSMDYPQCNDPLLSSFGSELSASPDFFASSVDGLFEPCQPTSEMATPLPMQYPTYQVQKRPQTAICKPKASKMRPAMGMKPKQPVSTTAKRESHNLSERHRRLAMKESFDSLRRLIPEVTTNDRVHTGQILKAAIDFVHSLQREEAELIREKEALQEEIRRKTAAQRH